MHRILLEVGSLTIYSYGFFVALGYLTAILSGIYLGKKDGIDIEQAMDLCLYIVVSALIGSRLLYVIAFWESYAANPIEVLMFWRGGFVLFGGLIGGILATVWHINWHKMPTWKVLDAAAVGTAFGLAVGRVGCFLNGCCYGCETNVPWAVKFPLLEGLRHPTQLYASFGDFTIGVILLFMWLRKKQDGYVFISGMFLYPVFRFCVEFFRVEPRYWVFSGSQWISILFFITAIWLLISKRRSNV